MYVVFWVGRASFRRRCPPRSETQTHFPYSRCHTMMCNTDFAVPDQGCRRGFGSGTTEGRVGGGGSEVPPRENFVKKTQNPAFWELLAHFWRSVQSSRVQYSVRLQLHGRSTSRSTTTSLEKGQSLMCIPVRGMHRWILIFLLRFCTFRRRTTLFEKWYGHGRTSRSGCYAPADLISEVAHSAGIMDS